MHRLRWDSEGVDLGERFDGEAIFRGAIALELAPEPARCLGLAQTGCKSTGTSIALGFRAELSFDVALFG